MTQPKSLVTAANTNRPHIRLVFVQMLFALVIGQLALKVGDLVVGANSSNNCFTFYCTNFLQHPYVFTHILLCIVIITSSWVGWQASKSSDNPSLAGAVFSFEYAVLLADLFLVICYFVIVRGTEISSTHALIEYSKSHLDYPISEPNVFIETFWSSVIFGTYLVWDILTKLYGAHFAIEHVGGDTYIKQRNIDTLDFLKRSYPTFICFGFSFVVYSVCSKNTAYGTALTDIILISLFLTFRGWKQILDKKYLLKKDHLSSNAIRTFESSFPGVEFPILIRDDKFNRKYFLVKILPATITLLLFCCYCIFFR